MKLTQSLEDPSRKSLKLTQESLKKLSHKHSSSGRMQFGVLAVFVLVFPLGIAHSCALSGERCVLQAEEGETRGALEEMASEEETCCPGLYCFAPSLTSCSPRKCKGEGVVCNPGVLGSICCRGLRCILPPHPMLGTPGKCARVDT